MFSGSVIGRARTRSKRKAEAAACYDWEARDMRRALLPCCVITVFALICCVGFSASGAGDAKSGAASVTFTKDVAPIFYRNCAQCHRPGEIAPMSLLTYKDARPWARAMKNAVVTKTMPPWFADTNFGHFANERRLKQNEIDTIANWVDAGAAEGDAKD